MAVIHPHILPWIKSLQAKREYAFDVHAPLFIEFWPTKEYPPVTFRPPIRLLSSIFRAKYGLSTTRWHHQFRLRNMYTKCLPNGANRRNTPLAGAHHYIPQTHRCCNKWVKRRLQQHQRGMTHPAWQLWRQGLPWQECFAQASQQPDATWERSGCWPLPDCAELYVTCHSAMTAAALRV